MSMLDGQTALEAMGIVFEQHPGCVLAVRERDGQVMGYADDRIWRLIGLPRAGTAEQYRASYEGGALPDEVAAQWGLQGALRWALGVE